MTSNTATAPDIKAKKRSARPSAFKLLARNQLALMGAAILALVIALVLITPILPLPDPDVTDPAQRLLPPFSEGHFLGTDHLGRDLLSRLLWGTRVSLAVGISASLVAALFGSTIGIVSGYFGGRLDALFMRLTDGVIALPLLPLLIVLAAIDLQKLGFSAEAAQAENMSLYRIVAIVALVGWTTVARLVRATALSLRERPFVLAARAQGASSCRIMTVHILPNLASPIIVATTLSVGNVILLESVLSFLGLGIQPPLPSWGNLLTNAQELIWDAPALAVYPGLAIFVTVIAFNFVGDGLQDALDPRSLERGKR